MQVRSPSFWLGERASGADNEPGNQMHGRREGLRKVHLVLDGIVIVGSMLLAFGLHGLLRDVLPVLKDPVPFREYATLVYLTLPLWLVLIVVLRLHESFERMRSRVELVVDLVKLHIVGLVGLALVLFLTQGVINRSLVALYLASTFCLMYVQRAIFSWWVRSQHERGQGQLRILLVGSPSHRMAEFAREAGRDPLPPAFLGYLAAPDSGPEPTSSQLDTPRLGSLEELSSVLHDHAVDHVVFFPPCNRPELVPEALAVCEELGVQASFSVDMTQLSRAVPRIAFLYQRPFVEFNVVRKKAESLAVKHGADVLAAGLGLLVLTPLLVLTALAIWISMGRPIFFSQVRVGLYGRPFRMLKFRTMVADAEARKAELVDRNEMGGPVFKLSNDPRVTRLGRFLRRTSIDELPQLFNVLVGAMSVVGPRPLPLAEQQQIRGWQRRRLSMKPGITGLWQVSGRSNIAFDEWIALDLRYVDEWSLGLDLRILLRTIPVVLLARGAR